MPVRGADSKLQGRVVSDRPTQHKHVPDGMTIDAGGRILSVPRYVCLVLFGLCAGWLFLRELAYMNKGSNA